MIAIKTLRVIDNEFVEATISSADETDTVSIEAEMIIPAMPLQVHRVCWTETGQCAAAFFHDHEDEIRELLAELLAEVL